MLCLSLASRKGPPFLQHRLPARARVGLCQAGIVHKDSAEQPPAAGSTRSWRVDRRMTALKAAGAALFVVVTLLFGGDPRQALLGLAAAAALGAFAARDLLAPVRLAAGPDGITVVTGFASRRHIPWTDIERVRVDSRNRLGRRLQFLEIDTGDNLHLFSGAELSADPHDVADSLTHLRTGR